jgi:hypothetical protein
MLEPIYEALRILILVSIYVGLVVAMFVGAFTASGWRYKIAERSPKLIYKVIDCTFCFCFWMCVITSIVGYLVIPNEDWLIVPISATPIARYFA